MEREPPGKLESDRFAREEPGLGREGIPEAVRERVPVFIEEDQRDDAGGRGGSSRADGVRLITLSRAVWSRVRPTSPVCTAGAASAGAAIPSAGPRMRIRRPVILSSFVARDRALQIYEEGLGQGPRVAAMVIARGEDRGRAVVSRGDPMKALPSPRGLPRASRTSPGSLRAPL
jgi:hypothetical protein